MPRKCPYYTPKISRFLVSVLYHEARSRRMPMTNLTEVLLTKSLEGSQSWRTAEASLTREGLPRPANGRQGKNQSATISSGASAPANGSARRLSPARAASHASPPPSSPTKASKGTTLHRLSGNQNSPALNEFHRA